MLRRRRGERAEAASGDGDDSEANPSTSAPTAQRPRRSAVAVLWVPFVRPHYKSLVAAWLLRLLSSLLFLALPWRLRVGLDYIFTTPNPGERTKQLSLMTLVYAGRAVVKHLGAYCMNRFSDSVCAKLRVAVFEAIQRRPLEETAQAGVSRLLATLTADVEAASGGVTTSAVHLLETAAYALGGVALCLRLNLRLTCVVVVCVLPTVLLSRLARRDASSSARAEVMAAAETSLLSAELVRAYGMEGPEAAVFRRAVARSSRANKEACLLGEFLGGLTSFISALSLIAVVWAGSVEAFAGRLTAGDLIAFVYYCAEIGNSTEKTFRIYSELMALSGALGRIARLVDTAEQDASHLAERRRGSGGGDAGSGRERAVTIPLGPASATAGGGAAAAAAAAASSGGGGAEEDQWTLVEEAQQAAERAATGRRSQGASVAGRSPSPPPRSGRSPSSPAAAAAASPSKAAAGDQLQLSVVPRSPSSPGGGGSRLPHAVELSDVWFRYSGGGDAPQGGPPALKGVNLAVRPGQVLAVVGPSGSGKSTLLKLCMGLFAPTAGAVLVAGCSVQDISLDNLRAQIGWVAQGDGAVLPGTVRENIQFGAPSATEEEIKEAAIAAAAFGPPGSTGFIQNLPQGFDTKLASRNTLSGGMAARISLARALVRRPALLLLDEVSAGLDSVTEGEVMSAVRCYASSTGATVIIVAHRLVACRRVADAIAVMNAGEVIETGTHDELVSRGDSLYRTLYRLQEVIGE